jgi:hypothetical protein
MAAAEDNLFQGLWGVVAQKGLTIAAIGGALLAWTRSGPNRRPCVRRDTLERQL